MPSFRKIVKSFVFALQPMLRAFLRIFFDRAYLHGKNFDGDIRGYIWAFRSVWSRNILRLAPPLPFPASPFVTITNWRNLEFAPEDINNFQSHGAYFQCSAAKITLGKGTFIAPNVGLITANHDLKNLDQHLSGQEIKIGDHCWIGMNSVVMPGVTLGNGTIVAAGSVVTRSFTEGNCLLAGSPAQLKRQLTKNEENPRC
jgi:hypothetical protein